MPERNIFKVKIRRMQKTGEMDLHRLVTEANPSLDPAVYVFCTVKANEVPRDFTPLCVFNESEGVTLIVKREEAEQFGIPFTFACRRITMQVYSALEAVGFLAAIAAKLASVGISANTVSAYYHDHLFVPEEKVEVAMQALRELSPG
jgi:uncharacterized protein